MITTINEFKKINENQDQYFYHGSPYLFDKFDFNKIGSGDGKNKYGYGLYFTTSIDTAKYYAIGQDSDLKIYTARLTGLDRFYKWDEPITEDLQSQIIRRLNYLEKEDEAKQIIEEYEEYGDLWTLEDMYVWLTDVLGTQKETTHFLLFCDVLGIIASNPMLDGLIYVAFKDTIIKIVEIDE